MIQIHQFLPNAECEYSGRTGEAVEVSADDGSIRRAVVSIPEPGKLLRFRHRQQQKHGTSKTRAGEPATAEK